VRAAAGLEIVMRLTSTLPHAGQATGSSSPL
jgi:hypothetical protein